MYHHPKSHDYTFIVWVAPASRSTPHVPAEAMASATPLHSVSGLIRFEDFTSRLLWLMRWVGILVPQAPCPLPDVPRHVQ